MRGRSLRASLRRGVTLIEITVVVAIIGLMASISFPAINSGLDSIRLRSAADSVASFLNTAMNRTERRQEVIEIVVLAKQKQLVLYSAQPGFTRSLQLPPNIAFVGDDDRHVLLLPNSTFPRFTIDLVNGRGVRRRVAIDPITGAPVISNVEPPS